MKILKNITRHCIFFTLPNNAPADLVQWHTAISRFLKPKTTSPSLLRIPPLIVSDFEILSTKISLLTTSIWPATPSRRSSFCPTSSEPTNCRSMNLLSHTTVILSFYLLPGFSRFDFLIDGGFFPSMFRSIICYGTRTKDSTGRTYQDH